MAKGKKPTTRTQNILDRRKSTTSFAEGIRRRLAGDGKLTPSEKRKAAQDKIKRENKITAANRDKNKTITSPMPNKIRNINISESERRALSNISNKPKPKPKQLSKAAKTIIGSVRTSTVKSGDTLTAIAKRTGTTVANLKKINPSIKDVNKIKPGQKIMIGGKDTSKSAFEGKPRTIAEARKKGSKYFFDKNGKKKIAVTAEELKKSGKTLAQWLKS